MSTSKAPSATVSVERMYTFDDRFYQINKEDGTEDFYPSATTILHGTESSKALDMYKQEQAEKLGIEGARLQLYLAAERGTRVHDAIERNLKGEDLFWFNADGKKIYDDFEWQRIARFMQWKEVHNPKALSTEEMIWSDKYRYAGTFDAVCQLADKKYLCDWKTSKAVQDGHRLQSACYWHAYKERFGIELDGILILALNSRSQQGWSMSIKDKAETKALFKKFLNRLAVFNDLNPNFEPKRDLLPTKFPA